MQIEIINIDLIKPYWRNPRNIDKAVEAVKKSIEEYGYNSPILIDKENVIVAGHTRYKALKELGYKEVPCVRTNLSEDKIKQYRIVDNKTSELTEWDDELLTFEMREIEELENMKFFFTDKELEKLSISIDEIEDIPDFDIVENNQDIINIELEKKQLAEERKEKEQNAKINQKILEKKQEESEKMENKSKEVENDYIEICCPNCDEVFTFSKAELLRADKIRKLV